MTTDPTRPTESSEPAGDGWAAPGGDPAQAPGSASQPDPPHSGPGYGSVVPVAPGSPGGPMPPPGPTSPWQRPGTSAAPYSGGGVASQVPPYPGGFAGGQVPPYPGGFTGGQVQPYPGASLAGPFHPAGGAPVAMLRDGRPLPPSARVDPVGGTPFGVAYLRIPATVSGAAIGSLLAGIASVFVSFVAGCFGVGTEGGVVAAGAFAVLATAAGLGAVGLGVVGLRQAVRAGGRVSGRGMAIGGLVCGGCGIVITGAAMLGSVLATTGGAG